MTVWLSNDRRDGLRDQHHLAHRHRRFHRLFPLPEPIREELERGHDIRTATAMSCATAGKAVFYSGITVATACGLPSSPTPPCRRWHRRDDCHHRHGLLDDRAARRAGVARPTGEQGQIHLPSTCRPGTTTWPASPSASWTDRGRYSSPRSSSSSVPVFLRLCRILPLVVAGPPAR